MLSDTISLAGPVAACRIWYVVHAKYATTATTRATTMPTIALMPRLLAEAPRAGQGLPGALRHRHGGRDGGLLEHDWGTLGGHQERPAHQELEDRGAPPRKPRVAINVDAEQPPGRRAEPQEADQPEPPAVGDGVERPEERGESHHEEQATVGRPHLAEGRCRVRRVLHREAQEAEHALGIQEARRPEQQDHEADENSGHAWGHGAFPYARRHPAVNASWALSHPRRLRRVRS